MKWLAWLLLALLLLVGGVVYLLPLARVITPARLAQLNLRADAVAGTVWDGRVDGLRLGPQPLGSFNVAADPASLLSGTASASFSRLPSLQGLLTGTVRVEREVRGVEGLTGRLPVERLAGRVPLQALVFNNADLLFRPGGGCVRADGQLTANMQLALGPVDLSQDFAGTLACRSGRVEGRLATASDRERIGFTLHPQGRYDAWLTIRQPGPLIAAGLQILGFRQGPDGMSLAMSGQIQPVAGIAPAS